MRFVSPLLKRVVYPCLAAAGYFRSLKKSGLAVITYHGVLPQDYKRIDPGLDGSLVTTDTFRKQLRLLKANYNVISPEEMHSWCLGERELPHRAVLITCDDGLLNNLTEMLPVLEQEGLQCLFFVTTASAGDVPSLLWYEELLLILLRAPAGHFRFTIGDVNFEGSLRSPDDRRGLWWRLVLDFSRVDSNDRELSLAQLRSRFGLENSLAYLEKNYPASCCGLRLLTRAELQRLAAAGMTIGAHTCTHPVLALQPVEVAWKEIAESRNRLESVVGRKIWAFAYPFGHSDSVTPQVMSMAQEAGFEAAFMNIDGGLGADLPLYAIPRVHVNADMNMAEFEAHVSGLYRSLQRRFSPATAASVALDFNSNPRLQMREPVPKEKTA
jgi:peptidoglycan/xylan/chitin deacetylase (PgdA/CDA1 family)